MDEEHYHLNRKLRSLGQDFVPRQGLRHVGFVAFIFHLGVSYGDLLPMPGWLDGAAALLSSLALAVILYWFVGWWLYSQYGVTPNTVPRSACELASWAAAIIMMCTVLIGSEGLIIAIASLLATTFGLVVMLWIVVGDLLGKRKPVHWLALWLLIFCAAMVRTSSLTEQMVGVGLVGMSVGLAIGISLDHRRFVRSFQLRAEEA